MQVERVSNDSEFQTLASDWNCLAHGVPFRGWEWLSCWWKHYAADRELYVVAARDDNGVLVGVAPFYLEQTAQRGRVLQFLGSGEVCSDYLTLLTTIEHEDAVVAAIGDWLAQAAASDDGDAWDLLELDGVLGTDRIMAKLVGTLAERGCAIHRRAGTSCWAVPLPATWESFLASRSTKSRRRKIKRWKRAVDESDFQVNSVTNDEQLPEAMETFIDVHQRRRRSLGEPGCFASEPFRAFMVDVAVQLLATDQLDLTWLERDGQTIAVEFNIVSDKVVYAYQGGVDPDFLEFSPGHMLTTHVLARLMDDGYTTYDLLRGDEGYKADWGATSRPTTCFRIVPNQFGPRVRQGVWVAGRTLKDWVKGGLTLTGMH